MESIAHQKIFDESLEILEMLKEEVDEEAMLLKLISMVLEKQSIQGPNYIGIPKDKLAGMLERAERRRDDRGGRRGKYRGNRGSRSRNGAHRGTRNRHRG